MSIPSLNMSHSGDSSRSLPTFDFNSSIRFTIGRFTTEEEIDFAVNLLKSKVGKLRELSPLWDMFKEGIDINSIQWAAH